MHRFNGVERDAVSGLKEGLTTDYVSGVAYAAHGGMAKMTLGPKVEQWCYNERLQPAVIRVGAAESVNCAAQAGDLLRLAYGYGTGSTNNGNVMSQEIARLGFSATQSYLFDALNRIQNVTEGAEWQTYGYSRHGNWWVEAASANWTPGTFTPRAETWYNAATNQLTSAGLGIAHLDGNLTAIGAYAFSYDAENRMATSTVNSTATVYGYDGEGRRVKKGSTYYVHDAFGQLAAEYGGTVSGAPRQYLTGDHLGSTRLVVDASGVMAQCLDYFPFGELIARSDCGTAGGGMAIKFTGKERDGETGLDYFGARYLSGAMGRFTTPDPDNAGSYPDDPQSWNAYSYARNNPLRFTDPDGLNYRVCDTQGHCRDVTDDEWNKWREAQGQSIIVTPGGSILDRETEKKIGSSQYYNEKLAETLQEAGNRADALIKDAAKRMAVDAIVGGVGGAVLGQFAPRVVEFAVSKLPVSRVFPSLARLSPKILRQMQTRGWTRAQIQEAFESGERFPAVNRLRGGTSATRYVHPTTGKAVTIDNATGEVIQVGGAGFTYTHY